MSPAKTPIDYTLHLVSPIVFDPRVKRAQEVLNGGNVFGLDWLDGPVDGLLGLQTMRAFKRSKRWLGYPEREITGTYGPALDSFLHGLQQPTEAMAKRAAAREKAKAARPLGQKALARLESKLGYVEQPGNVNVFGEWYGANKQPYCAMACTWAYVGVGSKAFVKGSRWAFVPFLVADARAGRFGVTITRDPKPGDPVAYDWDGGEADHVGLFDRWVDRGAGYFVAVEANTSPDDRGSQSNGGGVFRRGENPGGRDRSRPADTRRIGQVEAFVRVQR